MVRMIAPQMTGIQKLRCCAMRLFQSGGSPNPPPNAEQYCGQPLKHQTREPQMSERPIVKQPACAAPISSSGLVPGLPLEAAAEAIGIFLERTALGGNSALPSLSPPCQ